MTVLILGKRSFLSAALKKEFEREGYSVFLIGYQEIQQDVEKELREKIEEKKPDYLINCVALADVDQAEKEEKFAFEINANFPKSLGIAAASYPTQVIHFSTDYVFDGEKKEFYTEEDQPNPLSVYGKTKLEGERRLLEVNQDALIIRTAWLYGFHKQNFVLRALDLLKNQEPLTAIVDQIGSPTWVDELAYYTAALKNHRGIYHLVNQGAVSRYQFLEAIVDLFYVNQPNFIKPSIEKRWMKEWKCLAPRPSYSALSSDRAQKKIGEPIRAWDEALKMFLQEAIQREE